MRIENDKVKLSSGKEFSVNMGIIGIREEMVTNEETWRESLQLTISEGSDMRLSLELTSSERQEIAQFMLERWAQWGRIELPRWPG